VTVEVWISLHQNIIDTAANEWKKRLHACVRTIGRQLEQFCCWQLKNKTTERKISQNVKTVNKICF